MRTLLIATTLSLALVPAVQANPLTITPSVTMPEPGTFCGFLTLCEAEVAKPALQPLGN